MTSENSCAICLETFSEQLMQTTLGCGHVFHTLCILQWSKQTYCKGCPQCRKPMIEKDPEIIDLTNEID